MKMGAAASHPIRVVLHGGLGNQLFQYFIGLAEAYRVAAAEVRLLPDLLARYETARDLQIRNLLDSNRTATYVTVCPADLLARLRLPKIAKKLTGYEQRVRVPAYGTLLDGYFQELRCYAHYDAEHLARILSGWRLMLAKQGLLRTHKLRTVTHIRLKDFFKTPSVVNQFARKHLAGLAETTDVITDDEDVIADTLAILDPSLSIRLRSTRGLSAWDLFSVFTEYKQIRTNGSSLAFWAAVLTRAHLESSNSEHVSLWRFLTANEAPVPSF